jgi:hypothetical protein
MGAELFGTYEYCFERVIIHQGPLSRLVERLLLGLLTLPTG